MSRKVILIIGFILLVIVVGLVLVRKNDQTANTPTPTVSSSGLKTYTSQALGIQFEYDAAPPPGGVISVKETGNKVFVYAGNVPENGQSVEVFQKPASESFEASIKRQALGNQASCQVVKSVATRVGYQIDEATAGAGCNQNYTQTNGIRYFLFDPAHPTQFAFLNIGQYPIIAHDNVTWQDTLRFTK